jgi:FkbM family methyltransferase
MILQIMKFLLKTSLLRSLASKLGFYNYLRTFSKNAFSDQQMLLSDIRVQTIFDIGANVGQTAVKYSKHFPKSTIYSFEPFPKSFEELRNKFDGNSLVKPVQFAVSNEAGTKTLYINQSSATNSLLPIVDNVKDWIPSDVTKNISTTKTSVTTIDEFCKKEAIKEIQILKLDIQGGELLALKGAVEKLSAGAISLIYTEIEFVPLYKGQALFYEICDFLSGYGYTLFDMYEPQYAKNGQVIWGDAIFLSPLLTRSVRKKNYSS